MTTVLITIAVLGVLIFFHELGHFWFAKRNGIYVHEFAIGFGPRVLAFQRGETTYSLRALPLGGFVRMAGMHPDEEGLHEVPPSQRFLNKPIRVRFRVIFGGPLFNLLLAVLVFALLFAVIGVATPSLTIEAVEPGMPAAEAGLLPGDRIAAINDEPIDRWEQVVALVQSHPEETLTIAFVRSGQMRQVEVVPLRSEQGGGVIGIRPGVEFVRHNVFQAIAAGFAWTGQVIVGFFGALSDIITGTAAGDVIGPIGIGAEIGAATRSGGLPNLLALTALLSINLGLINLLPIPALDGSRLLFLVVEWLRGRPLDPDKEGMIHFVGFALMIGLLIFISIRDLARVL